MPRCPAPLAAAPLVLALITVPALAQTAGSPSTPGTTPRALPGTGGVNAVPDTGGTSNTGEDRGTTNDPNSSRSGPNGETPMGTGPLQGGGGPLGQHSPPQR